MSGRFLVSRRLNLVGVEISKLSSLAFEIEQVLSHLVVCKEMWCIKSPMQSSSSDSHWRISLLFPHFQVQAAAAFTLYVLSRLASIQQFPTRRWLKPCLNSGQDTYHHSRLHLSSLLLMLVKPQQGYLKLKIK
ncbi:hypothetical protein Fcan01_01775 [Folsomia candida]|uniref:Uncharacterized protein n=1 Tax=Folsomia candida TaxID=158441 RepID=A0A226F410_FOLCA|nr:hypothetical protein Fcan01_01775 [Folsomia candida]